MVFFPQDTGDHEVVVKFGAPDTPFLTRTFGNVQSTAWDGETFSAKVRPPYDATNLWEAIQLHAIIKPPAGKGIELAGAVEGVETDGNCVNAAYRPDGFSLGLRLT